MAVDITVAQLATALRTTGSATEIAEVTRLRTVAIMLVEAYAPDAPTAVQNEAVIRMCGYIYDAGPGRGANPFRQSGAASLLSRYRERRALAVGGTPSARAAAPAPAGGAGGIGAAEVIAIVDRLVAEWARSGNDDDVPADKLPDVTSGVDADAVNDLIEAGVADWAEQGNTSVIPRSKLPTTSGGTATTVTDGSIGTDQLANNAVTTAKIKSQAVTANKLAPNAVAQGNIVNNAVTEAKIRDYNVSETKIASSAVTESRLKDGAVTTRKIAADAITSAKIADQQVGEEHIKNDSVKARHIADAAVATAQLHDGAVTAAKLAPGVRTGSGGGGLTGGGTPGDGTVTEAKLADSAVTARKIADGSVSGVKIADGAFGVDTQNLADGAVTAAKLGASAVTTEKIGTFAVTAEKIDGGAVTTFGLRRGNVLTSHLKDGAVTTDKIDDGAVTAEKLAGGSTIPDNSIAGIKIKERAINADYHCGLDTVTTKVIRDKAITARKLADGLRPGSDVQVPAGTIRGLIAIPDYTRRPGKTIAITPLPDTDPVAEATIAARYTGFLVNAVGAPGNALYVQQLPGAAIGQGGRPTHDGAAEGTLIAAPHQNGDGNDLYVYDGNWQRLVSSPGLVTKSVEIAFDGTVRNRPAKPPANANKGAWLCGPLIFDASDVRPHSRGVDEAPELNKYRLALTLDRYEESTTGGVTTETPLQRLFAVDANVGIRSATNNPAAGWYGNTSQWQNQLTIQRQLIARTHGSGQQFAWGWHRLTNKTQTHLWIAVPYDELIIPDSAPGQNDRRWTGGVTVDGVSYTDTYRITATLHTRT